MKHILNTKLYSKKDLSLALGTNQVSFKKYLDLGLVEEPTVKIGKRMFYTEEQFERLSKLNFKSR